MTWFQITASVLVSMGPLAMLFLTFFVSQASLIIIALAGAVLWLSAATLASVLWRLLVPLAFYPIVPVVLSWLCISGARCFICWLWFKLHRLLSPSASSSSLSPMQPGSTPPPPPRRQYALEEYALPPEDDDDADVGSISVRQAALSVGVGFAFAQTVITQAPLWEASAGPGTLMSLSCSGLTALALSSLLSSLLSLLQIVVTALTFDGYKRKSVSRVAVPAAVYLLASLATVVNSAAGDSLCIAPLLIDFALLLSAAALAFYTALREPPPLIPRRMLAWRFAFFPSSKHDPVSDHHLS